MDWSSVQTNSIMGDNEPDDKMSGLPSTLDELSAGDKPSRDANSAATDDNESELLMQNLSGDKLDAAKTDDLDNANSNNNSNSSVSQNDMVNAANTHSANPNEFNMDTFDAADSNESTLLDFTNHELPHLNLSDPNEINRIMNQDNSDNSTLTRDQTDNTNADPISTSSADDANNQAIDAQSEQLKLAAAAGDAEPSSEGAANDDMEDEEIKKVNGSMLPNENSLDKLVPNENESAVILPPANLDDYNFAIPISSSPVYLSEIISTTSVLNADGTGPAAPLVDSFGMSAPSIEENMLNAFPTAAPAASTSAAAVASKPKSSLDESIDSCIEKFMKSHNSNRFNFKCKQCAYSTKFKVHIIEHMLNVHDVYVMQCPEPNCNKKFKDEWKLKRHLVSNREHPPLEDYSSLNDVLRRHIDISLQKTGFPCPLCQLDPATGQFLSTDAQNNDVVDGNKILINEKNENNFLYLDEYEQLVEHMSKQHPSFNMDAYFICKQCGQIFLSKYKLSCHLFNVHSGKRKNRSRGFDGGPSKKRGAIYDPVMESIIATTNRYLYPNESYGSGGGGGSGSAGGGKRGGRQSSSVDSTLDELINNVAKGQIMSAATTSKGALNPKYKFFCDICNRYFKRERDIFTHTKIMHKQINIDQVKFVNIQKSGHGSGSGHGGASWRGDGGSSLGRKCPICSKTFKEVPGKGIANNSLIRKSFIRHMQTQHGLNENGERLIECPVCEKSFFNKQQLERHMHTHEIWIEAKSNAATADDDDSENKIKLVNHNNEFNDISSAIEDVVNSFSANTGATGGDLNSADDSPIADAAEESSAGTKFTMPDYKDSHSILYCHECVECKQFYKSIKVLTKHKREVHKLRPIYRCANLVECNLEFEKVSEFLEHARIHPQRNIFCSRCKETFTNKNLLRHHMKNVHYSRKYAATGRTISKAKLSHGSSRLSTFNSSSDDGMGGKQHYSCHTCQKNFSSKNSLHNHLATHSDVRLFLCDVCSHAFKTRKDLSRHAALHDSTKHKRCEKCGMTFKTSFHLKRHSLTRHSNIRPFTCDICEMTFARKDKLKQHEAKHVNHPLFKCSQCEKGFYRKEHLKDHEISKHSKQYPFICEHCSKGFVHAKDLHRHIRVRHLGVPATNIGGQSQLSSNGNTITAKIIQMPSGQAVANVHAFQAGAPAKKPRGRKSQQAQATGAGSQPVQQTIANTTNMPVNDFKSKKISSILKTQLYQSQVASAQVHSVFQTTANLASLNFNNPGQQLQLLTPIGAQPLNTQNQQQRILSSMLPIGSLQDFNVAASSSNQLNANNMPKMAQILTPMNLTNLQPITGIDMRNKETKPGAKERKKSIKNAPAPPQSSLVIANMPSLTVLHGGQQTVIQPVQNSGVQPKAPKNSKKSSVQAGAGKRANKNANNSGSGGGSSIGINLNDIASNNNGASFFASAPSLRCEQCQIDFQEESQLSKHIKSKHPPAQTFSCSHCHKTFSNKPAAKAHIDNTHTRYKCPVCPETFSTRNYINKHFASKHSAESSDKPLKPIKEMIVDARLIETPIAGEKETLKTFTIEANSNMNKNSNLLNMNPNMNNAKNFMQLPSQMLHQNIMNAGNHMSALPTFNTGNQNFQHQMQINPALLNNENMLNPNSNNNGLIHANNSSGLNANMLLNNFNNKLLQNSASSYISHPSSLIDMNQQIHGPNIWSQSGVNNSGHKINQIQNGPFGTIIAHENSLNSGNMFVQSQIQKQPQMQNAPGGNVNATNNSGNTQFYLTNLPIQMASSASSSNMQMSNAQSGMQSGQSGLQDSRHIQIHILSGNESANGGSSNANTMATNMINSNMNSSTATLNDIIANNSSKY